ILIVHGRQDTVVPLSAAHRLRDYLLNLGAAVQYRELDMGHEISLELLELLREFILLNR
ncbi:MAG: alpha/beta hydrolase, partial [Moorea sp. SIO2I5]|nr:alpha/beta hydrolase [Moorena sp. SIO2I5]